MILGRGRLVEIETHDIQNGCIILPNSVECIGTEVFKDQFSLKQMELNTHVSKICNFAFCGCKNLKSIEIKNPNCILGVGCFEDCINLKKVVLPQNLIELQSSVFRNCTELEQIVIPNTVKKLIIYSFLGCEKLKEIKWREKIYSYADLYAYRCFY